MFQGSWGGNNSFNKLSIHILSAYHVSGTILGFSLGSGNTVVVVQSPSCAQLFATPRTAAHQAPLSFSVSQSLLKFMSIESVMLSNRLIFFHSLLLLPSVFPKIRERRSNWSILNEINPEYLLEGLVLKLKLQYFGHLVQRADSLEKTLMLGILAVSRKDQLPTLVRLVFLSTGR